MHRHCCKSQYAGLQGHHRQQPVALTVIGSHWKVVVEAVPSGSKECGIKCQSPVRVPRSVRDILGERQPGEKEAIKYSHD